MSSILTAFVTATPLISNGYNALYFNILQTTEEKSNSCTNIAV